MRIVVAALLALGLLAGCSSEPPKTEPTQAPAKQEKKEPEYLTARSAFQKMYIAARGWAPDARPFRLQSQHTEGAPAQEGKAGLWTSGFASASRRSVKRFQWSGLEGENAPERGTQALGVEDTYNPANASTLAFDMAFLKVDSDRAFEVAQQKGGGKKLTAKDPKHPVTFMLDWDRRKNELVWHVLYGTSINDAKLRVAVDASTGEFIRVEK